MPTKAQKREHRRRYEEQKARGGVMFRGKMTLPEELAEIFRPRLVQDCGAYTIWKYDVEAPITVFGHTFNGMKDVMRCVQQSAVCGFGGMSVVPEVPELAVPGIYCARIFQPYPKFDVYDLGDSRDYVNVFSPERLLHRTDWRNCAAWSVDIISVWCMTGCLPMPFQCFTAMVTAWTCCMRQCLIDTVKVARTLRWLQSMLDEFLSD